MDEAGEFAVGGEAECDELRDLKLVDVRLIGCGEDGGEAEALFEADYAILDFEGVETDFGGEEDQDQRHEDEPGTDVGMSGVVVVAEVAGDEEVE